MSERPTEKWFNCYGARGDLFTKESYRHPAKMAVPLCERIFRHGCDHGYWKPGDIILDPMCGIGTTLIVGAVLGYRTVGIELETHFVTLALENVAHASRIAGRPLPVQIIQGDARELSKLLRVDVHGAFDSPPYADQDLTGESHFQSRFETERPAASENSHEGYDGAVSSPPYANTDQNAFAMEHMGERFDALTPEQRQERRDSFSAGDRRNAPKENEAQIGNLRDRPGDVDAAISSPPFEKQGGGLPGDEESGKRWSHSSAGSRYDPPHGSGWLRLPRAPDGDARG